MFGTSGASMGDLDQYVPDLHRPPPANSMQPSAFHVVKTHDPYRLADRERFRKAIYIVRDPRDVVISYYRFLRVWHDYGASFDDFLGQWLAGRIWPCSWRDHVDSWTRPWDGPSPPCIKVLRYVDLLSDTEKYVAEIAEFLGYHLDPSAVRVIVAPPIPMPCGRRKRPGSASASRSRLFSLGRQKRRCGKNR